MKTTLCSLFLLSFIFSCSSPSNSNKTKSITSEAKNIYPLDNQHLDTKMNELKISMIRYMKDVQPSYTEEDVNTCMEILNKYRIEMAKANSKEEGMKIVKTTILELNALNAKCGGSLIETSEREKIAEIIIVTGNQKGYNTTAEDITEPWREW